MVGVRAVSSTLKCCGFYIAAHHDAVDTNPIGVRFDRQDPEASKEKYPPCVPSLPSRVFFSGATALQRPPLSHCRQFLPLLRDQVVSLESQDANVPTHWVGDTEAFPGQPGSSPGPPPGGTCLEHLPGKATRRHPEKMPEPPQLAPLSRMPSPSPQSTCGLVEQTPMNPPAPWRGYRAGPVFHDRDENRTVPPGSEVLLSAVFSSPVPWHRLSRGG
ncbi:hypothetical protein PO909_003782 [Leuciscus waleckii]